LFKEYARVVKSIIRRLSYPRSKIFQPYEERPPKVLWNGVDLYKNPECSAMLDDSLGQCSISTVPVEYVILSSSYLCITYFPLLADSKSTRYITETVTAFTTTTTTEVEPPSKAKRTPRADANGGGDIAKRQNALPSTTVKTITITETIIATASVCPTNYTQCGPDCKNLQNDDNNCGYCGLVVSFLLLDSIIA
jgi:hypothetical protein